MYRARLTTGVLTSPDIDATGQLPPRIRDVFHFDGNPAWKTSRVTRAIRRLRTLEHEVFRIGVEPSVTTLACRETDANGRALANRHALTKV